MPVLTGPAQSVGDDSLAFGRAPDTERNCNGIRRRHQPAADFLDEVLSFVKFGCVVLLSNCLCRQVEYANGTPLL